MGKVCNICGELLSNNDKKNICKYCKREKSRKLLNGCKKWVLENGKWILLGAAALTVGVVTALSNNSENTTSNDTDLSNEDDSYEPRLLSKQLCSSDESVSEEKCTKYRVTYEDIWTGEKHTIDYNDIDNGYEDYLYYKKHFINAKWEHILPDEQ